MKIHVPATTANLGAGFDCLGLALDLWMSVEVNFNVPDIQVITIGQGQDYLPQDERNFFIRIINRILRQWNEPPVNRLHLFVTNDIPLSRGLGSSAAVTVAAVKIAAEIVQRRVSGSEAVNIAAQMEGHADNVAAAYYGGLILTGIKDHCGFKVVQLPLQEKIPLALVAIPEYRMRTVEARQSLPRQVSMYDAVYNSSRTGLAVYAWTSGNYQLLKFAMQDRLHQYYRMNLIPGARDMLKVASQRDNIYGAALSGSGSTMIALGEEEQLQELAAFWQDVWDRYKINGNLKIIRISRSGVAIKD